MKKGIALVLVIVLGLFLTAGAMKTAFDWAQVRSDIERLQEEYGTAYVSNDNAFDKAPNEDAVSMEEAIEMWQAKLKKGMADAPSGNPVSEAADED